MTLKCTTLFNGKSSSPRGRQLTYGFSETWYIDSGTTDAENKLHSLAEKRILMCAKDTQIVGFRLGDVTGRSNVIVTTYTAPRGNDEGNVPVDSALCQLKADAGFNAIKKFWIHDLPDDWIAGGALDPARRPILKDYLERISALGFQIRVQNQAAANALILSIDANGLVTTQGNIALLANDLVSFLRCRDNNNRPIRGKFAVASVTTPTTFTLAHWTGQVVGRSGRVRKVDYQYKGAVLLGQGVDSWLIKCGGRKVGRPFFQLRGRAANRR